MLEQAPSGREKDVEAEPAVRRIAGDAKRGCLILCDHASNALPRGYRTLGLPPAQLERHIGYDIGAAGVAERLARLLNAPAVLSRYSRLLIDPNRGADDPTLVMRLSDGAVVPGNADLSEKQIARRVAKYYDPYHAAIEGAIEAAIAAGSPPAILSIHSFTPEWKGVPRPWHITILWDKDPRLPLPLIGALRAEEGLVVGENEPYSGKLRGDCLYRHGTHRGLAHALVEIRQDLIGAPSQQEAWAQRLARIMSDILAQREAFLLDSVRYYGSHTDNPDFEPQHHATAGRRL